MPRPSNEVFLKFLRFKVRWERQYPGQVYVKNPKDMGWCKSVLVDVPDNIMDERMEVYFRDEWYGENCHHALAPFASNINTFTPRKRAVVTAPLIDCPVCGKKHPAHKECVKGDLVKMPPEVGEALTLLTKKLSAG